MTTNPPARAIEYRLGTSTAIARDPALYPEFGTDANEERVCTGWWITERPGPGAVGAARPAFVPAARIVRVLT
ncbi:MAG: hypothetical protein Q4F65_13855 [Propionibacteriaceae bacterium]|nr:hypothetical protein [Propionibacteriaceae bacterium]